jgi:GxxExxY protein
MHKKVTQYYSVLHCEIVKKMDINQITHEILDSAYKVHTSLGPGLLESAYKTCLAYELRKKGLKIEEEKPVPVIYEGVKLDCGYRLDLLVEDAVVVELKTVDSFSDVHFAQILTYLRFADKKVGLLINFNVKSLRDGIKRFVI